MRFRLIFVLGLMLVLIGCQAQEAAVSELPNEAVVTNIPTEVAAATEPAAIVATEPAPPTATMLPTSTVEVVLTETPESVVEAVVTIGRTSDGVFFIGAEDAPVTVIDYSDFL